MSRKTEKDKEQMKKAQKWIIQEQVKETKLLYCGEGLVITSHRIFTGVNLNHQHPCPDIFSSLVK